MFKAQHIFLTVLVLFLTLIFSTHSSRAEEPPKPLSIFEVNISRGTFAGEVKTQQKTVSELLNQLSIELDEDEKVTPSLETLVADDMQIRIQKPSSFSVIIGDETKAISSHGSTVTEVLADAGITLDADDYSEPSAETSLNEGDTVSVFIVENEEIKEVEQIAFSTKKQNDDSIYVGESAVVQSGSYGEKEIAYSVKKENGVEIERSKISEKVISEPTEKIVAVGTKEREQIATTTGGDVKEGVATFYYGPTHAASRVFPKGAVVKVTNTANGKSITVTIDDFGGYGNRIIDLRKDHFEKIGKPSTGILPVIVERIK